MLSPAITLIAYVIQAEIRGTKAIDVNMVFTSIAIINIVTSPMVSILSTVAELAAMIADFDRMQTYLASPDREDKREILDSRYTDAEGDATENMDRVAVSIDSVTIRPASTADPVLRNISAVLKDGNLIVVSGAVGTDKTTLAKALLGDLPPDSGVIQTAYGSIAIALKQRGSSTGLSRTSFVARLTTMTELWTKSGIGRWCMHATLKKTLTRCRIEIKQSLAVEA